MAVIRISPKNDRLGISRGIPYNKIKAYGLDVNKMHS